MRCGVWLVVLLLAIPTTAQACSDISVFLAGQGLAPLEVGGCDGDLSDGEACFVQCLSETQRPTPFTVDVPTISCQGGEYVAHMECEDAPCLVNPTTEELAAFNATITDCRGVMSGATCELGCSYGTIHPGDNHHAVCDAGSWVFDIDCKVPCPAPADSYWEEINSNEPLICSDSDHGDTCFVASSCLSGFTVTGTSPFLVTCDDGEWFDNMGCQAPCGWIGDLSADGVETVNSTCNNTVPGTSCDGLTCALGYTNVAAETSADCLNDVYTLNIDCQSDCSTPDLTGLNMSLVGTCDSAVTGGTCNVTCDVGFGAAEFDITCNDGTWIISDVCIADCSSGPTLTGTQSTVLSDCSGTSGGEACYVQCDAGYTNASFAPYALCAGESWDLSNIDCAADCFTGPDMTGTNAELDGNCTDALSGGSCSAQCLSGFRAASSVSMVCTEGNWDLNTPCQADCTGAPSEADMDKYGVELELGVPCTTWESGNTCSVQCKFGASGSPSIQCIDGLWIVSDACVTGSCSEPSQSILDEANAQIATGTTCTGADGGNLCLLECKANYLESGQNYTNTVTCFAGWNVDITCIGEPCSANPSDSVLTAANAEVVGDCSGTLSGDTCPLACVSGFVDVGTVASRTATCIAGEYMSNIACVDFCAVGDSFVSSGSACSSSSSIPLSETCDLDCASGYETSIFSSSTNSATCGSSGVMTSEFGCTRVQCSDDSDCNPSFGLLIMSDVGEVIDVVDWSTMYESGLSPTIVVGELPIATSTAYDESLGVAYLLEPGVKFSKASKNHLAQAVAVSGTSNLVITNMASVALMSSSELVGLSTASGSFETFSPTADLTSSASFSVVTGVTPNTTTGAIAVEESQVAHFHSTSAFDVYDTTASPWSATSVALTTSLSALPVSAARVAGHYAVLDVNGQLYQVDDDGTVVVSTFVDTGAKGVLFIDPVTNMFCNTVTNRCEEVQGACPFALSSTLAADDAVSDNACPSGSDYLADGTTCTVKCFNANHTTSRIDTQSPISYDYSCTDGTLTSPNLSCFESSSALVNPVVALSCTLFLLLFVF